MRRGPLSPFFGIGLLTLCLFYGPTASMAEPQTSLYEKAILDKTKMPQGTFWGGASEMQAQKLAHLLSKYRIMEILSHRESTQKIDENKGLIHRNLITAEAILRMVEETSRHQGSGEITLFFQTGRDTFPENGLEHYRLVRFMDYLVRNSRGRTLFFISIGKASTPGNAADNRTLSQRRAHFPKAFIDHYLINTPHTFYEVSGNGESQSPESRDKEVHKAHQHTRLIAFYAKRSPLQGATRQAKEGDKPQGNEAAPMPPSEGQTAANPLGMNFVWIAPGNFIMGSPLHEPGRDPDENQNAVTLTRGFYMQTTEVTQAQWSTLMETNPSEYKECGGNCPVNRICWTDAMEFIRRLNTIEGSGLYRLPTEAEWEYACRAGGTEAFSNGPLLELACAYDTHMDRMGWNHSNSGPRLHEVAQKAKNRWGLYDMHGNVWEWCMDLKGEYGTSPRSDPNGSSKGHLRVIRGGSWSSDDRDCRSANRLFVRECNHNAGIGFRLVMEK